MTHIPTRQPDSFQPLAGILAILLPGLGYFALKQPKRALLTAIPILALILMGLLIGGLDVVNRADAYWWFLVQCGIGPLALLLNHLRESLAAANALSPALAKVNEVGTLCIVMAGMLNLIAIIDCFFHATTTERRRSATPHAGAATP